MKALFGVFVITLLALSVVAATDVGTGIGISIGT